MTFSFPVTRHGARRASVTPGLMLAAGVLLIPATSLAEADATRVAALDDAEAWVSELRVEGEARSLDDRPTGQTAHSVTAEEISRAPAFSISDVLAAVPGVTLAQGNGPRDVSISVRGSNARQTYGVRNLVVFEDDFPVTQPDGLARTDLTDPHAYERIDVMQGPSSALYGNYAIGGALKFYLRPGRSLNGAELGIEAGDEASRNVYLLAGAGSDRAEASGFASQVRGDGDRLHTEFRTATINGLATFEVTPKDRLTLKLIDNGLRANLAIRQSLEQFRLNPYQEDCERPGPAGCPSLALFANGANGARRTLSATEAGLRRDDRRTILGARWTHDFAPGTVGRLQLVWDNRDIDQPTGATSAVGAYPSYNLSLDLTRTGPLVGRPAVVQGGLFFNTEDIDARTFNVPAAGSGVAGALIQRVDGRHANLGARLRVEYGLSSRLTLVGGAGVERTWIEAAQTAYAYPAGGGVIATPIPVRRSFDNVAPEAALTWTASRNLTLRAHLGRAYGTPQAGNLFVTPAGVPGNNTGLRPQTMTGLDLGVDWRWADRLSLSLTAFDEVFRNELVSQSAGAGLQAYSFNAPRSWHRGLVAALDWTPAPLAAPGARLSLAWMRNDQVYRSYVERLSAGGFSTAFDRRGRKIPGVAPDTLNARVTYAQASGPFEGLGGFLEWSWRASAFMDNANLLKAPGYSLASAGLSYDPPAGRGALSRLRFYLAVQNLADEAYVASASNIADSLNPATGAPNGAAVLGKVTGSIYSGAPRTLSAGLRARF